MKRRWAIVFWALIVGLAALSWIASRRGWGLRDLFDFEGGMVFLVGAVSATVLSFVGMRRGVVARWPATLSFVGVLPLAAASVIAWADHPDDMVRLHDVPAMVAFAAFPVAAVACLYVAIRRPIAAPAEVARARVVDP